MGILDQLKGIDTAYPAERLWQLSVKVGNNEYAAIQAVTDLVGGNKSDAIRVLLKAGWEAIEDDIDLSHITEKKWAIQHILDSGEGL